MKYVGKHLTEDEFEALDAYERAMYWMTERIEHHLFTISALIASQHEDPEIREKGELTCRVLSLKGPGSKGRGEGDES